MPWNEILHATCYISCIIRLFGISFNIKEQQERGGKRDILRNSIWLLMCKQRARMTRNNGCHTPSERWQKVKLVWISSPRWRHSNAGAHVKPGWINLKLGLTSSSMTLETTLASCVKSEKTLHFLWRQVTTSAVKIKLCQPYSDEVDHTVKSWQYPTMGIWNARDPHITQPFCV